MRSEGPYEKRKRFAYPTPLPICAGYVLLESGENQSGNVHYSNETRRRIPSREAFQSFRDQRGSFLSAYSTQMCTCVNLRHAPDRTGQLSQINTQLRRPWLHDNWRISMRIAFHTRKWFQISFVWHRPHYSSPYTTPVGFPTSTTKVADALRIKRPRHLLQPPPLPVMETHHGGGSRPLESQHFRNTYWE